MNENVHYAFGNNTICITYENGRIQEEAAAHLSSFRAHGAPSYWLHAYNQEPPGHYLNGSPIFRGQFLNYYQRDDERIYHIDHRDNQNWVIEYLFALSPSTCHGSIFYRTNRQDFNISPFDYRPLSLFLGDFFSSRNGILFHATGVIYQQQTLLFTGFSGAGKSTIARLWEDVPGAEIISDERILVHERENQLWAFGTPWKSSAGKSSPKGAPLKKIFILNHGESNKISELKPSQAIEKLYSRSFPAVWDRNLNIANIELISKIGYKIPVMDLSFVPDFNVINYLLCHS